MKRSYYLKRIVPCVLVIFACLIVIVMSMEAIGFTHEQRMRIAEKAQLVGPSNIIGKEENLPVWGDVLIGQSTYGYTLFSCDSEELFYHKKAADFTTFSPTNLPDQIETLDQPIPVFVFSEQENAIYAKLTVTIFNTLSGSLMEYPFSSEANLSENGYFLFEISTEEHPYEFYTNVLTEILNQQIISYPLTYGTVTLELYDESGNLLETYTRNDSASETK